ncbi:MAG: hypothetical protein ACOCVZ_01400, partial [Gemmatimonadota bacterium]
AGEAASVPQLEARLDLRRAGVVDWSAYLVGHYDRKDLDGVGVDSPAQPELEGVGIQVGGSVARGPLAIKGNAYWGRALGHQFGQLAQFGDIEGWGAWTQALVRLSERWDVALFVGQDDPDDADVLREVPGAGRLLNRTWAVMGRYTLGPYALALEGMGARTRWAGGEAAGPWTVSARQVNLSVLYRF